MPKSQYQVELLEQLDAQLQDLFDRFERTGRDVRTLGDPRILADRMVAAIPRSSASNLELGPFYSTSSLTKWMGVTRQYVHELTRQKRILAVVTADGHKIYPSFQFGLKGAPLPGLAPILSTLEQHLEPTTQAMWLMTKQAELDGLSPAEWLKGGRNPEVPLSCALVYMEMFSVPEMANA